MARHRQSRCRRASALSGVHFGVREQQAKAVNPSVHPRCNAQEQLRPHSAQRPSFGARRESLSRTSATVLANVRPTSAVGCLRLVSPTAASSSELGILSPSTSSASDAASPMGASSKALLPARPLDHPVASRCFMAAGIATAAAKGPALAWASAASSPPLSPALPVGPLSLPAVARRLGGVEETEPRGCGGGASGGGGVSGTRSSCGGDGGGNAVSCDVTGGKGCTPGAASGSRSRSGSQTSFHSGRSESDLSDGEDPGPLRLLIVRHAQSANKARVPGQPADPDPELTAQGREEAELLGQRLAAMFVGVRGDRLPMVVSSPMRRCLLTIAPTLHKLPFQPGSCICRGDCYEFRCAGRSMPGTPGPTILKDFPEFILESFGPQGTWDYRGSNDKETEPEFRTRMLRVAQWLRSVKVRRARIVILACHQTVADLLCQILVDGTEAKWEYGELVYRLRNACFTELTVPASGPAKFGTVNSTGHLRR